MPTAAPDAAPTFSPLYQQIKALITSSLEAHEWRPGEMIPSEMELATRFKVSQGTVRKAIDVLAAEKLLVRRQGKGTFVATHGEARSQFRFLRLAPDEGEPSYPESRIIECRRIRATAEVARVLDLKPGDSVVYLKRVLLFAARPCVVDELHLPGGLFRGLTAERLAEGRAPLYGTFETDFGVKMIRADEKIRAVAADSSVAQLLDVPSGTPLLQVDRVAFSYGEKPVEVRRGLYLTQQHHYRNTLN